MSDSDIVQDFLIESYENLDRLDRELVGLEKNPHDRDALASVGATGYGGAGRGDRPGSSGHAEQRSRPGATVCQCGGFARQSACA